MTAVEYIFHYCRHVGDGYDNDYDDYGGDDDDGIDDSDGDDDDGDDDGDGDDGDGATPANKQESNTSPAHVSLSLSRHCSALHLVLNSANL